jgi:hypothetical protein
MDRSRKCGDFGVRRALGSRYAIGCVRYGGYLAGRPEQARGEHGACISAMSHAAFSGAGALATAALPSSVMARSSERTGNLVTRRWSRRSANRGSAAVASAASKADGPTGYFGWMRCSVRPVSTVADGEPVSTALPSTRFFNFRGGADADHFRQDVRYLGQLGPTNVFCNKMQSDAR